MVALAGLFVGLTALGLFLRWRGTLFQQRWLMWVFVFAVVGPYLSNEAGWVAAETGRQPYVVYPAKWEKKDGFLVPVPDTKEFVTDKDGQREVGEVITQKRTAEGVSGGTAVPGWQVLTTLVMFGCIYALLFAVWVYVIHSKVRQGPEEPRQVEAETPKETTPADLLEAAARLANPSGYSMTMAKDPRLAGEPPPHLRGQSETARTHSEGRE
jgi:cytochrome d ubiquinol oxidase subunit I